MSPLLTEDIRFSVAPMMDWTDRHCRFFHRLLSRRARLYTEMVTTGAVIHGAARAAARVRPGGASGRASARRLRAARARRGRADRRGFRLRRGQPERRLPVGPGAGRALRRLPDARARARRRLRRRDERGGPDAGDGQVPHRRRRAGPGSGARRARRRSRRGRRRCVRRSRPQGLARGTVAEARTATCRRSTTRSSTAQARAPGPHDRHQRRRQHDRGSEGASRTCRRRHDGPRRLSGSGAAAARRSASSSAKRRRSPTPSRPSMPSSPMSRRGSRKARASAR